jgi:hypothetical protein
VIVIYENKYVRYSGLSSRLPTISVEFPAVLVRFRISGYSSSVSVPVFSEPDLVFTKKNIETKAEIEFFLTVSVRFHR